MFAATYGIALRRYWRLVVLASALTGLLAGLFAGIQPASYQARLRLLASFGGVATWPSGAVPGDSDAARRLSESRVRSYTQKATSTAVLHAVINDLRLSRSTADLAGDISAWTPLDTTFINISVRDSNAQRAVQIGNAIATELIHLADTEKTPPNVPVLDLTLATAPSVPDGAVRPFWPGYAIGGALAGFAAGLGLAMLWAARRRIGAHGSEAHAIGSSQ